jgi:bifunctional enzyme CysN/CysC
MILGAHGEDPPLGTASATGDAVASPNVTWHSGSVERGERWDALAQRGAVVWMTGLPSSGKSTVAMDVEKRLLEQGRSAYVLDGDNLRHGLNGDLGFDAEARAENIRRTAHVARLMADAGTVVLVSLVSPYAAEREKARQLVEEEGLEFVEVFVNTPLEECEARDPKGLYAKARSGEIASFTGVSAPYEAPEQPDVELRPGDGGDQAAAVLAELDRREAH